MKKFFDILIPFNAEIEAKIVQIEQKISIKLPPLYRIFLGHYIHGMRGLNLEKYTRPDGVIDIVGPPIYIKTGFKYFIGLDYFNDIDYFLNSNCNFDNDEKLLDIASLGYPNNGGLCVGYGENNKDEIWREYWDAPPNEVRVKVCDNIFEFIKGLVQVKQEDVENLWQIYFNPAGTDAE